MRGAGESFWRDSSLHNAVLLQKLIATCGTDKSLKSHIKQPEKAHNVKKMAYLITNAVKNTKALESDVLVSEEKYM